MYGPSMDLNQVPDNGQTKAKAPMRARRRDVGLPEALEYVRQEVLTDPLAGIGHDNLNARINPPRANRDAGHIEEILDELRLGTRLSLDGLKRTQVGSRSHLAFQQQVCPPGNCTQGSPQFMRDDGK